MAFYGWLLPKLFSSNEYKTVQHVLLNDFKEVQSCMSTSSGTSSIFSATEITNRTSTMQQLTQAICMLKRIPHIKETCLGA